MTEVHENLIICPSVFCSSEFLNTVVLTLQAEKSMKYPTPAEPHYCNDLVYFSHYSYLNLKCTREGKSGRQEERAEGNTVTDRYCQNLFQSMTYIKIELQ